jgi:hypothetical protein
MIEKDKDQAHLIENQFTKCLLGLKNERAIPESIFTRLKSVCSMIPRLYDLSKIHRSNTPMRSIFDMHSLPYESTARWLVEILEPIQKRMCPYSLRDSFEFVELIKTFNADKKIMDFFDMTPYRYY